MDLLSLGDMMDRMFVFKTDTVPMRWGEKVGEKR